ncbi:unnamed protein product, partial [Musa hybrid cultivar]
RHRSREQKREENGRHSSNTSMLPIFTEPQNGHASSKAAQGSQQQRWLQGSSTMHAFRRTQTLHRLRVEPIPAVGSLAAPLAAH